MNNYPSKNLAASSRRITNNSIQFALEGLGYTTTKILTNPLTCYLHIYKRKFFYRLMDYILKRKNPLLVSERSATGQVSIMKGYKIRQTSYLPTYKHTYSNEKMGTIPA